MTAVCLEPLGAGRMIRRMARHISLNTILLPDHTGRLILSPQILPIPETLLLQTHIPQTSLIRAAFRLVSPVDLPIGLQTQPGFFHPTLIGQSVRRILLGVSARYEKN